jgi:hypothetical protein
VPLEVKSFFAKYLNLLLIAIIALWTLQGCTLAAPAAINYGVSKITEPKTAAAQPAPAAPSQRTYPEYLTEMERINLEREKAGLSPRPILTQEEWVSAQAAGRPAAAPTVVPAPAPSPAAPAAPPAEKAAETK